MNDLLAQLLQGFLVVLLAPGFTGLVRSLRARLAGRQGPSPLQPYRDLRRSFAKEPVVAPQTSTLFLATPPLVFAITWLVAATLPTFTLGLPLTREADLLVLVGLLGAARFLTSLAGLDTGTAQGGMGASRLLFIAESNEGTLLIATFALSLMAGSTSPDGIIAYFQESHPGMGIPLLLTIGALTLAAISATCSPPVDNPGSGHELTLIHDATLQEYSGRDLALMEAAAQLRLLLFASLITNLLLPWGVAPPATPSEWLPGVASHLAKLLLAAIGLAGLASSVARMRTFRIHEFQSVALLLGLVAILLYHLAEVV